MWNKPGLETVSPYPLLILRTLTPLWSEENPAICHCDISRESCALTVWTSRCSRKIFPSPWHFDLWYAPVDTSGLLNYGLSWVCQLFPSHWTAVVICMCLGKSNDYRGTQSLLRNSITVFCGSKDQCSPALHHQTQYLHEYMFYVWMWWDLTWEQILDCCLFRLSASYSPSGPWEDEGSHCYHCFPRTHA